MNRYYVKPDQETIHWNFQIRPVAPSAAVFRIGAITDNLAFRRSDFTREWQFYWADLLALAKYRALYSGLDAVQKADIVHAFNSLTTSSRFINNGAGTDDFANYVAGENLDQGDPKIDPLICGFTYIWGDEVTNEKGDVMVAVKSFLYNEKPPAVPSLQDPRVMYATIIRLDGTRQEFPQLGGIPVPYPLITREQYYYPLVELRQADPPPAQEEDMYIFKAIRPGSTMNIRADHNTSAGVLGTLAAGAPVWGNELWVAPADGSYVKAGDTWLRVSKATGLPIADGWIAIVHMGAKYMDLTKLIDVQVDEIKFARVGNTVTATTKSTVFLEGTAQPPILSTEYFDRRA